MQKNNYMDIMEKNHMEIPWHDYTENDSNVLINKAGLIEKASVIGRVGLIMLVLQRNLVLPAPWMSDLCPSNLTVLTEKNVSHNP